MFLRQYSTRRVLIGALLAGAWLGISRPALRADVNIITPTPQSNYTVTDNLNIESGGSLSVTGFLDVTGNIDNGGLPAGIAVTGTLSSGGNVTSDANLNFVVQGAGVSSVAGELDNSGYFNFGNGTTASQLSLGSLTNEVGANLVFLPNATLSVAGAINNFGSVTFQAANFQLPAGSTLNNTGTWTLASGNFTSGGTMTGNGQLNVNGTATFLPSSLLSGGPTITATTLYLQGTVAPAVLGTPGLMTFDAATQFQGAADFLLVTPGSPGVNNDLIQITGGQTATLQSGTQFNFQLASPGSAKIGDEYEIIQGNVALNSRPVTASNLPGDLRIILRTNEDVTGFSNSGNAYYALVARNGSLAQIAQSNGGGTNAVEMGSYIDQEFPQDDHSIGTTNAALQWVRDTLDLMPGDPAVVNGLEQLSGVIYAPLNTVALQRQFVAYNRLASRLRDDLFSPCSLDPPPPQLLDADPHANGPPPPPSMPVRGWVTGYGFGGGLNGDVNSGDFTYGGGGAQVAFGYQPTERFGFGVFYDFGALNMQDGLGDQANALAHSWGGYMAWHRDYDYFLFVGGGGFSNGYVTRYIDLVNPDNAISVRAQGAPNGGQAAFYGEYGGNFEWQNVQFRPYLGLLYMTVRQNTFQESGAGVLDLDFENAAIDSVRTLLGSELEFRFASAASLVFTLQGAWVHEYVDETAAATLTGNFEGLPTALFQVSGPSLGRDWVVAGCGVRGAFVGEHVRPFANYDLVANTNQLFHTASGGIEYIW